MSWPTLRQPQPHRVIVLHKGWLRNWGQQELVVVLQNHLLAELMCIVADFCFPDEQLLRTLICTRSVFYARRFIWHHEIGNIRYEYYDEDDVGIRCRTTRPKYAHSELLSWSDIWTFLEQGTFNSITMPFRRRRHHQRTLRRKLLQMIFGSKTPKTRHSLRFCCQPNCLVPVKQKFCKHL